MTDPVPEKRPSPTDEELAAMLEAPSGKKRKKRRDDTKPSPRLPEALYYYLFMLVETAIVLGVWGAMQASPREVMSGPSLEAPVSEWIIYNLRSAWQGLLMVISTQWWLPFGIALVSAGVFYPATPRGRKRAATFFSSMIVGVFFLLIALKFVEDMGSISGSGGF